MELVIKRPTYANGVYIALQLIKKRAYVGESNDIFRRIGEHIYGIAEIESEGYSSNLNLINEDDKRIEFLEVHNNINTYKKRGWHSDIWTPWIYDETIYMFLMRKYGYTLYNDKKDNVGYKRSFILKDTLTSPIIDLKKYNEDISKLKEKTISYLLKLKLKSGYATESQISEDIDKYDLKLKEIFEDIFDKDIKDGVWQFSSQDLEQIWNNKVRKIEQGNKKKTGKDFLSMSYYLIKKSEDAKKYVKEMSGKSLHKGTVELCGIKPLSQAKLAEMIQSKKMDTTIFSSFGAYLGQSATTILATKSEDLKRHKLIQNGSGEWEIILCDTVIGEEKGFCEWSLKNLNEIDTRDFFETTNENKKEPKYIFLTYTPSRVQSREINIPRLNPTHDENFGEFKKRITDSITREGKGNIAQRNQVNWKKKEKKSDLINIPDTMFPSIIGNGENRALLISDFYVLDGYVKDYNKMYEYYWAHFANLSNNGMEITEVTEDHCYYDGKDNYDKVEKIREGVYRTYKKHKKIPSQGPRNTCGRIRGVKERKEFAEMVLSKEFYDDSEENRDYRNVIIAELTYPYIVTIKE